MLSHRATQRAGNIGVKESSNKMYIYRLYKIKILNTKKSIMEILVKLSVIKIRTIGQWFMKCIVREIHPEMLKALGCWHNFQHCA